MIDFLKRNLLILLCGMGVVILIFVILFIFKNNVSCNKHLCIVDLNENKIVYCCDVEYYFINTNDIFIKKDDSKIILSTIGKDYLVSENCLCGDNNE